MTDKPKTIKGIAIKFKGKTYDKISYFGGDSFEYSKGKNFHFTNVDADDVTTNVYCNIKDVEFIIEKKK